VEVHLLSLYILYLPRLILLLSVLVVQVRMVILLLMQGIKETPPLLLELAAQVAVVDVDRITNRMVVQAVVVDDLALHQAQEYQDRVIQVALLQAQVTQMVQVAVVVLVL
jgi:hypothetical protein